MMIDSLNNRQVVAWNKLKQKKYRDEAGLFLVEGEHLVREAAQAGLIDTVLVRQGAAADISGTVVTVSDRVMAKLSHNVSLNDVIAVCRIPDTPLAADARRLVVLENVQDPGNVGTILRTACAFGYDGVLLTEDCASVYGDKAVQASQGALFHVPVLTQSRKEILARLEQRGIPLLGTSPRGQTALNDFRPSQAFALAFGSEGQGLSDELLGHCRTTLKIEMEQFESLNVAVAAGICLWKLAR